MTTRWDLFTVCYALLVAAILVQAGCIRQHDDFDGVWDVASDNRAIDCGVHGIEPTGRTL